MRFQRLISLGRACKCAYQIKRHIRSPWSSDHSDGPGPDPASLPPGTSYRKPPPDRSPGIPEADLSGATNSHRRECWRTGREWAYFRQSLRRAATHDPFAFDRSLASSASPLRVQLRRSVTTAPGSPPVRSAWWLRTLPPSAQFSPRRPRSGPPARRPPSLLCSRRP